MKQFHYATTQKRSPTMKKIVYTFVFLTIVFAPFAFSGGEMPLEPVVTVPTAESTPPFSVIVTTSGALTAKPGQIFTQGGDYSGMELPYLISDPVPIVYPRWAVDHKWEGHLDIAIEVLLDGSVGRFKVMRSTGHDLLDETATRAVRSWKFHPAVKDGKPLVTCIQIPIMFRLVNE